MCAKFTTDAVVMPGNIRLDSSTQEFNLSAKAVTPDGRAFRYIKCGGTALVAGKLYDGPKTIANHTNLAVVLGTSGATAITVTLGGTAVTANDYVGGVIVINDVTGEGFTYSIKSHPAQSGTTSDVIITLDNDEPVVTALDTSSQASLVLNQYNAVIIHATTEIGIPIGIANTQVTEDQFGWIQTRGPVSAFCNATTGIGLSVAASDTSNAGGVEVGDGVLPVIGYAIAAGVAGEFNPIFLTID